MTMRRSEILAELRSAKRAAVEQLLVGTQTARQTSWVVRTHPDRNVVGIGVGRKIKRGRSTRTHCVRIYVERKIPRHLVHPDHLLPEGVEGVVTDVVETGRFQAFLPRVPATQRRVRPARPGCSIGFQFPNAGAGELMAGTLSAVVTADGVSYILSNNHVLANENALPPGTAIFQPGLLDGGNVATDRIATLARFIPLEADKPNRVDCALAAILDAPTVRPAIMPKIGRLTSVEPIEATEGMRVEKTGRATGYTTGTVFDVSATAAIQFDLGMLTFEDQVLVRGDAGAFSDGGDSGSLIVDRETGRATGLLIGGSPQFAIANHIGDVLQALNVKLVC
jgi:S1-C subfamily serine protease